jgi:vacuolar protein sorting-associated protein 54
MATFNRASDLSASSFNQYRSPDSIASFKQNQSTEGAASPSFDRSRSSDMNNKSPFQNRSSDIANASLLHNKFSGMASSQRKISSDIASTPSFQSSRSSVEMAMSPSPHIRSSGLNHLDPEVYSAGQSLASILNNPHVGKGGMYGSDSSSWAGWFFSSTTEVPDSLPSSIPLRSAPEITRADFGKYLDSISDSYGRFADVMDHSNREKIISQEGIPKDNDGEEGTSHGDGLVACLREIPQLYFMENFALEDGPTFQVACPYSSIAENMILQEKLSHYLDIIDTHLVREIEARSESFYEAQGQLEGLNAEIIKACEQIKGLKGVIQLAEVHVVESAQHIQHLNGQRESLLSLHRKLNLMSYVNQALGDLPSVSKLSGMYTRYCGFFDKENISDLCNFLCCSLFSQLVASADCGGALDVIDALQNLLVSQDFRFI